MKVNKPEIYEDKWVRSMCGRCYANCSIRVRVINGVAVKIEGDPDSTHGSMGGVCAKGAAGLQVLYDPNRLSVPLRRTNPEKGLFTDPRWKEISWEEAFDEIAPRMKRIISENPKKILWQHTVMRHRRVALAEMAFKAALGGASSTGGGSHIHCGAGTHPAALMVHAAWSIVPDARYCNYAIYVGSNKGVGSGHSMSAIGRRAADARARGMKTVSLDPMCHQSGGKAQEWIPVLPGTDGAVILAMCNVIVNELGIYDETFLKTKTNAPYLVGPDGRYVREKGRARGIKFGYSPWWDGKPNQGTYIGDDDTNKPLIWDSGDTAAKVYDDSGIKDYALEGSYEVNGVKCQPVFQAVREHLKQYSPDMASGVSGVPAGTIHRIAAEFAHAASIGSTITIEGYVLPLRPVSIVLFRGAQGHLNSHHTCHAVALLNQIVGACDVPGGTLGWPARGLGYPATGAFSYEPWKGVDGFLETDRYSGPSGLIPIHGPWPYRVPKNRHELTMDSMPHAEIYYHGDQEEIWQRMGTDYRIEMLLSWGNNPILSVANRDTTAEALKKIPFIVSYELFNNEFTESFADIVLPATCYLEEATCEGFTGQNFNHTPGLADADWCYHITQPVVKPKAGRRQWENILSELADRIGIKEKYVNEINNSLRLDEEYKLKPIDKLTPEKIADSLCKTKFGREHDWEWFKEHGFIRWPKKVEETYWRYLLDARTPIYMEYLVELGEKVKEATGDIWPDRDFNQYTPLISWWPSLVNIQNEPEYDMYCFSYRDILHTGSSSQEQPWLDEASSMNPYTYTITMNADTVDKKGLKDGDIIELESVSGHKVEGRLKTMEGQHPLTMGIAAQSGHWAKGQPIAYGKGTNFDILLDLDLQHQDPICGSIETCVRVKVRKVEDAVVYDVKLR
ncbi:molybdopterin-dependent oxidoreductase [Chloroflexota bacterium]